MRNNMDEINQLTEYDENIQSKELQMLKTMMPYLPPSNQRQITFIIQYLQLKNSINYIENNAKSLKASDMSFTQDKRIKMLSDIKKFCSPKEQETIDTLVNILSVMGNYDSLA